MGNKQATTASWSVDDWAYGTGANAVSIDEVIEETSKIPHKYFGGAAIENDASMHQMQNDLLSFDQSVKNLFRRKKNKKSKKQTPPADQYYQQEYEEQEYSEEVSQPNDSGDNQNYLQPIYLDANGIAPSVPYEQSSTSFPTNSNKATWRCSHCTVENKITERTCRKCGQAETRL